MLQKIKYWLQFKTPRFFNREQFLYAMADALEDYDKIKDKQAWRAIKPVISSLENLKRNTWDVERVNDIQQWLKDNFEVK